MIDRLITLAEKYKNFPNARPYAPTVQEINELLSFINQLKSSTKLPDGYEEKDYTNKTTEEV